MVHCLYGLVIVVVVVVVVEVVEATVDDVAMCAKRITDEARQELIIITALSCPIIVLVLINNFFS